MVSSANAPAPASNMLQRLELRVNGEEAAKVDGAFTAEEAKAAFTTLGASEETAVVLSGLFTMVEPEQSYALMNNLLLGADQTEALGGNRNDAIEATELDALGEALSGENRAAILESIGLPVDSATATMPEADEAQPIQPERASGGSSFWTGLLAALPNVLQAVTGKQLLNPAATQALQDRMLNSDHPVTLGEAAQLASAVLPEVFGDSKLANGSSSVAYSLSSLTSPEGRAQINNPIGWLRSATQAASGFIEPDSTFGRILNGVASVFNFFQNQNSGRA